MNDVNYTPDSCASGSEDPRVLLYAGLTALLLEFCLLTGAGWYQHWLAHPQKQGLDPTQFVDAEIFEMPPEVAKLRSETAAKSQEPVLSKVPHRGKKSKAEDQSKLPETNQTEARAPVAPTHGPLAVFAPAPVIPPYLRYMHFNASVVFEFLISAQGSGTPRLLSSSGNEELDQIAVGAAKRWQFRPAEQEHKAVDSKVRLRINFEVQ